MSEREMSSAPSPGMDNEAYRRMRLEKMREYGKIYRMTHKKEIQEKHKIYYRENIDRIKAYRQSRKEEIRKYNKMYYLTHREELLKRNAWNAQRKKLSPAKNANSEDDHE